MSMKSSRPLNPMSDVFVRYLLGTEENKDILIDLINAVFEEKKITLVKDIELTNPINTREYAVLKENVLDIKATDTTGRIINVEIQISREKDFAARSLYYWAGSYAGQLEKGNEYDSLNPTICINILSFNLFEDHDRFYSCFQITEMGAPENILTEDLQIHFIELEKLDWTVNTKPKDNLESWCYFFKLEGYAEEDEMPVLLKKNPHIIKADNSYKKFTANERMMAQAHSHEMWLHDQASRLSNAKKRGVKEGIEQGLEQGQYQQKLSDAGKMKEKGLEVSLISEITELTEEEINKL